MTPAAAARNFFTELQAVHSWDTMPAAQIVQAVQRSALRGAYASDVAAAAAFYHQHLIELLATGCTAADPVGGVVHAPVSTPPRLFGAGS